MIIERNMEIEKQNQMLLDKMSSIVHGSFLRAPFLKRSKYKFYFSSLLKEELK